VILLGLGLFYIGGRVGIGDFGDFGDSLDRLICFFDPIRRSCSRRRLGGPLSLASHVVKPSNGSGSLLHLKTSAKTNGGGFLQDRTRSKGSRLTQKTRGGTESKDAETEGKRIGQYSTSSGTSKVKSENIHGVGRGTTTL
jgi:hypothetical protein